MKLPVILILFFVFAFAGTAQSQKIMRFYTGTYTSEGGTGIHQCTLNAETGEIKLNETYKGIDNPSFLAVSVDRKYLYAVSESDDSYVLAWEIQESGALKFINKQFANGKGACFAEVSANGKWVAVANYGSGTIALYPVAGNGALMPASSVIENKGSGPDKARQAAPHAHSVRFSPFSDEVFCADLGTDQLDIFRIENGKLVQGEQKFVKMEPGAGPRHIEFHTSGKMIFVINELNSTITTIKNTNGKWERGESVSTLPSDFTAKSYCADIHISPDGRFLYGSNRGHNSIAVFDIAGSKLNLKATVKVEGNWPRNFAVSPDGKFLVAANQRSNNITVFTIDEKTGIPVFTGSEIKTGSPVCIKFLNQ